MPGESDLSYESFLTIAEASGLDRSDTGHMEQLYVVVQGVLPFRRDIEALDLINVEPETVYLPPEK